MKIIFCTRFKLCWIVFLAAFLPLPALAYAVGPPDGLDKMTTSADLICKARVISIGVISNSWFREISSYEARGAMMEIVSVFKGNPGTNVVMFQHYADKQGFGGFYSPQHYQLELGHSYLVFAAKTERAGEFRQLRASHTMKGDEGVMRTLDARPRTGLSIKDVHWTELNLLLSDTAPSNSLYAIQQLNALSGQCGRRWGQLDDFPRESVLQTLLPFCTHMNDEVATTALKCFQTGAGCEAQLSPYAAGLVQIADHATTIPRRVTAMAAFSGTKLTAVSNSLPRWLADASEDIRVQALGLLPEFPGELANQQLRQLASDVSPKVRAAVADAIGNGKVAELLPTLKILLAEPVSQPVPDSPLMKESILAGGRSNVGGDVHNSAGHALMKFEVDQVRDILKANLTDEAFRSSYLCKLAEKDTGPWLSDLAEVMESRRNRILKEVEASGVQPKTNYFRGRMALAGTYFKCWNIMHAHLQTLPKTAFVDGKLDRFLGVLENAGNTGSQEPVKIYELYRLKDLNERAAKYRSEAETQFTGYNLNEFFNRADARYTNSLQAPGR